MNAPIDGAGALNVPSDQTVDFGEVTEPEQTAQQSASTGSEKGGTELLKLRSELQQAWVEPPNEPVRATDAVHQTPRSAYSQLGAARRQLFDAKRDAFQARLKAEWIRDNVQSAFRELCKRPGEYVLINDLVRFDDTLSEPLLLEIGSMTASDSSMTFAARSPRTVESKAIRAVPFLIGDLKCAIVITRDAYRKPPLPVTDNFMQLQIASSDAIVKRLVTIVNDAGLSTDAGGFAGRIYREATHHGEWILSERTAPNGETYWESVRSFDDLLFSNTVTARSTDESETTHDQTTDIALLPTWNERFSVLIERGKTFVETREQVIDELLPKSWKHVHDTLGGILAARNCSATLSVKLDRTIPNAGPDEKHFEVPCVLAIGPSEISHVRHAFEFSLFVAAEDTNESTQFKTRHTGETGSFVTQADVYNFVSMILQGLTSPHNKTSTAKLFDEFVTKWEALRGEFVGTDDTAEAELWEATGRALETTSTTSVEEPIVDLPHLFFPESWDDASAELQQVVSGLVHVRTPFSVELGFQTPDLTSDDLKTLQTMIALNLSRPKKGIGRNKAIVNSVALLPFRLRNNAPEVLPARNLTDASKASEWQRIGPNDAYEIVAMLLAQDPTTDDPILEAAWSRFASRWRSIASRKRGDQSLCENDDWPPKYDAFSTERD